MADPYTGGGLAAQRMDDQSRIVTHLAENLRNQRIASSVY